MRKKEDHKKMLYYKSFIFIPIFKIKRKVVQEKIKIKLFFDLILLETKHLVDELI